MNNTDTDTTAELTITISRADLLAVLWDLMDDQKGLMDDADFVECQRAVHHTADKILGTEAD